MDNPTSFVIKHVSAAMRNATIRYVSKLKERNYAMRIGDRESLMKTYFKEELESDPFGRRLYHSEYRRVRFVMRSNSSFMLDYPSYYGDREAFVVLEDELAKQNPTLQSMNEIQGIVHLKGVEHFKNAKTIQEMQAISRHPCINPVIINYPEAIGNGSNYKDFADVMKGTTLDELHRKFSEDISKAVEDYLLNPDISVEEKLKHITDVNFNVNID